MMMVVGIATIQIFRFVLFRRWACFILSLSHQDKDDLGRPLSRHGHWRPRLYRELTIQLSSHEHKNHSLSNTKPTANPNHVFKYPGVWGSAP
jgi:hypothetical protein